MPFPNLRTNKLVSLYLLLSSILLLGTHLALKQAITYQAHYQPLLANSFKQQFAAWLKTAKLAKQRYLLAKKRWGQLETNRTQNELSFALLNTLATTKPSGIKLNGIVYTHQTITIRGSTLNKLRIYQWIDNLSKQQGVMRLTHPILHLEDSNAFDLTWHIQPHAIA